MGLALRAACRVDGACVAGPGRPAVPAPGHGTAWYTGGERLCGVPVPYRPRCRASGETPRLLRRGAGRWRAFLFFFSRRLRCCGWTLALAPGKFRPVPAVLGPRLASGVAPATPRAHPAGQASLGGLRGRGVLPWACAGDPPADELAHAGAWAPRRACVNGECRKCVAQPRTLWVCPFRAYFER